MLICLAVASKALHRLGLLLVTHKLLGYLGVIPYLFSLQLANGSHKIKMATNSALFIFDGYIFNLPVVG